MSTNSVHIIGGGIIGLCSAYYLNQKGYEVTILDSTDINDGTSFGNAGMIVPSHFIPLAAPGVIAKGIRWMFSSKSPFYIKPRLNFELVQWLWKFYQACNQQHLANSVHMLRDYNELSKLLYKEISNELGSSVDYREEGLMMLCKSNQAFEEEIAIARLAQDIGLEAVTLDEAQVQAKHHNTMVQVRGGVWYPGDAQVYSNRFMDLLKKELLHRGVRVITGCKVVRLVEHKGLINGLITSASENIPIDQLVIAAGAWSKKLLKTAGITLLLQDGKGYSITLNDVTNRPDIPSILSEAKVAITPMGNDLRITGTLEISNLSPAINRKRIQAFLEAVPQYFPSIQPNPRPSVEQIWTGYRPCTPDGIPYMGRINKYSNMIIATGHAMMGMSLGPASGKLVSEIIAGKKTSLAIEQMDPGRF